MLLLWFNNFILAKTNLPIVELLRQTVESSNPTGNFLSPVDDSNNRTYRLTAFTSQNYFSLLSGERGKGEITGTT